MIFVTAQVPYGLKMDEAKSYPRLGLVFYVLW